MEGLTEVVFNVLLAQLLADRGLASVPESLRRDASGRARPDVLVSFRGLTVGLEGKVDDTPGAESAVLEDARRRLDRGLADAAVAVLYPARLRQLPFPDGVRQALSRDRLRLNVVHEAGESGWVEGDLQALGELLERTVESLALEDAVETAARDLGEAVERFAGAVLAHPAVPERLARALDIRGFRQTREGLRGVARVAGLVTANAMMFQEVLARHDERVRPLACFTETPEDLADHWDFIVREVNYQPIFWAAGNVLRELPADPRIREALRFQAERARQVVANPAALRHDLVGRIFHRLLSAAKYLGAFYTSVPAATLLLKLALRPDRWDRPDWSSPEALAAFRVADPACGTGTLLAAAAQAIADNHRWACAERSLRPDPDGLHRVLLENVLYGYDVLLSALHLTASTLALQAPGVTFRAMHLFCLPLGDFIRPGERALGSLEYLEGTGRVARLRGLMGPVTTPMGVTARDTAPREVVELPELDLCVMNPPFTRSVGGNLLFGSHPEGRADMQRRLRRLLRTYSRYADIQAGLGAPFVVVAHQALRAGGRLALVLPKALLSGVAWGRTRRLIAEHYDLEYLIVSHDPKRWNFSENTDLSEVLLVARKRADGGPPGGRVVCVNLWRNPSTAVEALNVAWALARQDPPDPDGAPLWVEWGGRVVGAAFGVPWPELAAADTWMPPCAFAQAELVQIVLALLRHGKLCLPGHMPVDIRLTPLGNLGETGPDVREVHNVFRYFPEKPSAFPAFWNHDAGQVLRMDQAPNGYLTPQRTDAAARAWDRAGRVLLAERLRLNTQRLAAVRLSEEVLSNVWWPFRLHRADEAVEKGLTLWVNSSLGLLLLLARREETQGAWVKFKKPHWRFFPVPSAVDKLAEAYDRLAEQELRPLSEISKDPARAKIDAAVAEVLSLPDLAPLRKLLGREPVLRLRYPEEPE